MSPRRIRTVLEMIKFEHSIFACPLPSPEPCSRPATRQPARLAHAAADSLDRGGHGRRALRRHDHEPHCRRSLRPRQSAHRRPRSPNRRAFAELCLGVHIVSAAFLVLAASQLNRLALELSPVALAILFLYSYTKRFTMWSHLVLGFAWEFRRPLRGSPSPARSIRAC